MFATGECHHLSCLVRPNAAGSSPTAVESKLRLDAVTESLVRGELLRSNRHLESDSGIYRTQSDGVLHLNLPARKRPGRHQSKSKSARKSKASNGEKNGIKIDPGVQLTSETPSKNCQANRQESARDQKPALKTRNRTFDWKRIFKKSPVPGEFFIPNPTESKDLKDFNSNSTCNRTGESPGSKTSSTPKMNNGAVGTVATDESKITDNRNFGIYRSANTPQPESNGAVISEVTSRSLAQKSSTKVIHVDGVNYKVTMEPPKNGPRKNSQPSPGASPKQKQQSQQQQQQTQTKTRLQQQQRLNGGGSGARPGGTLGGNACSRPPCGRTGNASPDLRRGPPAPNGPASQLGESPEVLARLQEPAWSVERDAKAATVVVDARQRACDVIEARHDEAIDYAALRLRRLLGHLDRNEPEACSPEVLRHNLKYVIDVLEHRHAKDLSTAEENSFEDEMSIHPNGETPVPPEIKRWLLQTFSNSKAEIRSKRDTEKRSLRSVVHAVQAGMFVERIFRKSVESANNLPPAVVEMLKGADKWTFDVFELERVSDGNSLKFVFYHLLNKYDLIRKFKIPLKSLWAYCIKLQQGYRKHNNRYHNPIHAADVAQSLNCMLSQSGFAHWLSDLEIFSMITAAVVHDLEHTGTTNNFHTNTRSQLAQLYNDRSVLENHHISSAFRLMNEDDCDILVNMNKDDYQECRALMIDMVLATDMSQHFGQIKQMKQSVQHPEGMEKSRAMCLMIHCADINHPTKPWNLHFGWTERLVIEFFEQGDKERELGLPISPLCDRHTTMVAQSQIGFIDYVIEPTFNLLFDVFKQVNGPAVHEHVLSARSGSAGGPRGTAGTAASRSSAADDVLKRRFSDCSSYSSAITNKAEIRRLTVEGRRKIFSYIDHNRTQWQRKNEIESERKLFGEDSFTKAPPFEPDPLPTFPLTPHPVANGLEPAPQVGNSPRDSGVIEEAATTSDDGKMADPT